MNKKKGVSLITLIITIVVMIILAGAIILTLRSTNTIGKANEAKFKQNVSNYQDELNNYLAEQFLANHMFVPTSVNLYGTDVRNAIPSMSDADTQIFSVVAGKLVINSDADDDYKNWATQIGIEIADVLPASSNASTAPATSASVTSAPPASVAPSGGVIDSLTLTEIRASISADTSPGFTQTGGNTISTMTRVAQAYYGKAVAYSANGITDWKIFYIDANNIYLISADYIQYEKLPGYDSETKNGDMSKEGDYKATFSSTSSMKTDILTSNKMITRGYMTLTDMNTFGMETSSAQDGKYVVKSGGSLNLNFKCALYLLNETKWSSFVNTAQKGEEAYGGPTTRMMVASTNECWGTNVQVSAGSKTGYSFSGYTTKGDGYYYYWPVVTESIYTLTSSNANSYWIAGPSSYTYNYILSGYSNATLGYYSYSNASIRLPCPSFSKLKRKINMEYHNKQVRHLLG